MLFNALKILQADLSINLFCLMIVTNFCHFEQWELLCKYATPVHYLKLLFCFHYYENLGHLIFSAGFFSDIFNSTLSWSHWTIGKSGQTSSLPLFGHNVTKDEHIFILPLNQQHVPCSSPWFVWKIICTIDLLILFCILDGPSQFTNNSIVCCSTTKRIWIFWPSRYFLSALPFLRYLSYDFL